MQVIFPPILRSASRHDLGNFALAVECIYENIADSPPLSRVRTVGDFIPLYLSTLSIQPCSLKAGPFAGF